MSLIRLLTIKELPPQTLSTVEDVKNFWKAGMNGHYRDETAKVTVALPRTGSDAHLRAVSEAATVLQKEMGPKRFQFADN